METSPLVLVHSLWDLRGYREKCHAKARAKIGGGTNDRRLTLCIGAGRRLEGTYGDLPILGLDVGRKVGNVRVLGLRTAVQGQRSPCKGPEVGSNMAAAMLNCNLQL